MQNKMKKSLNKGTQSRVFCAGLIASFGLAVASAAHAASPASLHEHGVTGSLQWVNGNYESPKKSAECVAIQAKLVKNIAALKLSSEWRDVSGSESYKTFDEAHESLRAAECHKASETTQKDACVALTEKVTQHANALSETSQWKSLTASKSWKGLFTDVSKARKLGCIKATHMPQGMK